VDLYVESDGELVSLPMSSGGYNIDNDKITISITAEQEIYDESSYPSLCSICIESYPSGSKIVPGDVYEHLGGQLENEPDETPRSHGYIGYHRQEILLKWTVISISEDVCRFQVEANYDDPCNYYEEPKSKPAVGVFDLYLTPMEELWVPDCY